MVETAYSCRTPACRRISAKACLTIIERLDFTYKAFGSTHKAVTGIGGSVCRFGAQPHRPITVHFYSHDLDRGPRANLREYQTEYGKTTWLAADVNRTLMQAHDRANNRQAKSCAHVDPRTVGINAIETLEQMGDVLCGDANAWVGN